MNLLVTQMLYHHNSVYLLSAPHVRMSWLLIVAVLCCVFTTGLTNKVPAKDCGSQLSTIREIDINPCPKVPCEFKKNSTIGMTIWFIPNTTIDRATAEASATIWFITAPYTLDDSNACHGMKCPIAPGELATYTTNMYVNPKWPNINPVVKWTLKLKSAIILCFSIPVAIVG